MCRSCPARRPARFASEDRLIGSVGGRWAGCLAEEATRRRDLLHREAAIVGSSVRMMRTASSSPRPTAQEGEGGRSCRALPPKPHSCGRRGQGPRRAARKALAGRPPWRGRRARRKPRAREAAACSRRSVAIVSTPALISARCASAAESSAAACAAELSSARAKKRFGELRASSRARRTASRGRRRTARSPQIARSPISRPLGRPRDELRHLVAAEFRPRGAHRSRDRRRP